jgi:hypothetical protein
MIIIIVLKLNLEVDLRRSSGHKSGWPLIQVNIMIKTIIIIILEPDSRADPVQGLGHKSNKLLT